MNRLRRFWLANNSRFPGSMSPILRAVTAAAGVISLCVPPAGAGVIQEAFVGVSGQTNEASVFGITSADITQDITAFTENNLADLHGRARGSIGRFGAVGIEMVGFGFDPSGMPGLEIFANVLIGSDEHVNLTGMPQRVIANVVIDGGRLDFSNGATNMRFDYEFLLGMLDMGNVPAESTEHDTSINASLAANSGFPFDFPISGTLTADSPNNFSFTTRGGGLGAVMSQPGIVDIPISLQSFELGVLPPGHRMTVGYAFHMEMEVLDPALIGFVEVGIGEYSDPLNLAMNAIVNIDFVPVPEPTSIVPEVASLMIWSLLTFSAPVRRAPRASTSVPRILK